jgi:hypothetical protein
LWQGNQGGYARSKKFTGPEQSAHTSAGKKEEVMQDRRWPKRSESPAALGSTRHDANYLDLIKAEIKRLNISSTSDDQDFQTVVILLAAAFLAGPNTDRLISLTGYSPELVTCIANRMRESGLWTSHEVHDDEWFDRDDNWRPLVLVTHVLVAKGLLVARQREDGKRVCRLRYPYVMEKAGRGPCDSGTYRENSDHR